ANKMSRSRVEVGAVPDYFEPALCGVYIHRSAGNFLREDESPEETVKKLFALLVMSGAVLGALFLLTSLAHIDGRQTQALTLKPASGVSEVHIVSLDCTPT